MKSTLGERLTGERETCDDAADWGREKKGDALEDREGERSVLGGIVMRLGHLLVALQCTGYLFVLKVPGVLSIAVHQRLTATPSPKRNR